MTILDDQTNGIIERVRNLTVGEQFSLRTLYGGKEAFSQIATSGLRKSLGTRFRKAVNEGNFPMIAYSHHAESPAEHWYVRIE